MSDPVHSRPAFSRCMDLSLAVVLVRREVSAAAAQALQRHSGLTLPQPGRLVVSGATMLLWSGPGRFLAVRDCADAELADELGALLAGSAHVAAASDSRAVFQVAGTDAMAALNRLLPIDLHVRTFTPGSVALTTSAHIAVQVWRPGEDAVFRLACASSYGGSLRYALAAAGITEAASGM